MSPVETLLPEVIAAVGTTTTLTLTFNQDMDTGTGSDGSAWFWRLSNIGYAGLVGTWLTQRILQVSLDFTFSDGGSNVWSYDKAIGGILSALGEQMASETDVPL